MTSFGSILVAIIMILIIIQMLRSIADIFVQGYTLNALYDFSIKLSEALFLFITHLLLALGTKSFKESSRKTIRKKFEEIELQEVVTDRLQISRPIPPPPMLQRPLNMTNDRPK